MKTETINKYGFPLNVCNRCGGTGEHSYNQKDGTTCFGCSGTGLVILKRAEKAYAQFLVAVRKAQKPLVSDLKVGDYIAYNKVWNLVVRVSKTTQECGSSKYGNEPTVFHFYYDIELSDGQVLKKSGAQQFKRNAIIDSSPFLAMIKPAKKSKES